MITGGAERASGLHTHQRVPQQPWFSPSPLTFSVFTDSVSLVGMLAVGRRTRFRWHAGSAACPGVGGRQISAARQTLWERETRVTQGPQGLDEQKEVLRNQAPPPPDSLCIHDLSGKPTESHQEEILSVQMFPKESSLGTKLNPVAAPGTGLFSWFPGLY